MNRLVLLRHGESLWNRENLFTGWVDVDLSDKGREEASAAGRLLVEEGFVFDRAYTSVLQRAIKTLWRVLDEIERTWIPVVKDWRLNERHYGALQGLNKKETAEKHGAEQVQIWRRSYDIRPPALDDISTPYSGIDERYETIPSHLLPRCESLKDTASRVLPFWENTIAPAIRQGERIIISAHGNSLRALVQHLDALPPEKVAKLNIPTGIPLLYTLDSDLKPISSRYLGDPEAAQKAAETVAAQAGGKSS